MSKLLDRMIQDMQLHGHSEATQKAYLRTVRQLSEFYQLSPDQITEDQLRDYFLHRKNVNQWSRTTMKIAYCGIKFFFQNTLKRDWDTLELVRAENESKLPVVLSVDEARQILQTVRRPNNRAYLTTVYTCGLRLHEALNLQVPDIDSQRMLIHVHRGKGAKDRYVPLPESTLQVLRSYWSTHRNPVWIFPRLGRTGKEGPTATKPANRGTVQAALRRTLKDLPQIKKHVTVKTLRHSYATHLLEAGVSIRAVQQFLGHASLSTTMIYVHVTKAGLEAAYLVINKLMRGLDS